MLDANSSQLVPTVGTWCPQEVAVIPRNWTDGAWIVYNNDNAQCLPWMWDVVAVSHAPSPESNPDSPLPVANMVGSLPTIDI